MIENKRSNLFLTTRCSRLQNRLKFLEAKFKRIQSKKNRSQNIINYKRSETYLNYISSIIFYFLIRLFSTGNKRLKLNRFDQINSVKNDHFYHNMTVKMVALPITVKIACKLYFLRSKIIIILMFYTQFKMKKYIKIS